MSISKMHQCFFLGHHKCASTTLNKFAHSLSGALGFRHRYFGNPDYTKLPEKLAEAQERVVSVGCSNADSLNGLFNHKGIHLIRHPLDLLVSAYYSHLYSHPTQGWKDMEAHRQRLRQMDRDSGIFLEMDFWPTRTALVEIERWNYNNPNVYEARFEVFARDPLTEFLKWAKHLDVLVEGESASQRILEKYNFLMARRRWLHRARIALSGVSTDMVGKIAEELSFKNLAKGRARGVVDVNSHYRGGKSGEWKQILTDAHLKEFSIRYPSIFKTTGYSLNN